MFRRFLLFIFLSLYVALSSWAESMINYHYWFDNDSIATNSGHSSVNAWQMDVDVSDLTDAIHAIHLQATNGDSITSPPVTRYFLKTSLGNNPVKVVYFVDNDLTPLATSNVTNGTELLDVSNLPEGFHFLHVQVFGNKKSQNKTYCFIKTPIKDSNMQLNCLCWIDGTLYKNDKLSAQGGMISWELDVAELSQGIHHAQVQVFDNNGISSHSYQSFFLRVPTTEESGDLNCICWIDGEIFKQEKLPIQGGLLNWRLDVAGLPQGIHYVQIKAIDDNGNSSITHQSFFLRVPTTEESGNLCCYYDIDGEQTHQLATNMVDGTYHFNIDVSSLEDGPHRLSCMLTNDNGGQSSSHIINRYFIKIPVGGYGVKRYSYWLNDSINQAVNATLDVPTDPFDLISLLPFDHWPIRSCNFEFKIDNDQPVIFARNDMHIRFFDASDRFIDISRTFTDPVVKENVTGITLIQPGETKTVPRPQDNEIEWYKVEAHHGDSLNFKADRPCTIQVFSPSGEELLAASADKSVQWIGIHAPSDGTYYIAQHDMTATQGNYLSISYQHIDQYAILDYDVHIVGNGGASTITLNGNGFNDLYAIDLIQNDNVIHHFELINSSNSEASVSFDFTGIELGSYDAIFYFVEDSIRIHNFLIVELPQDINLDLTVSYPSSFLSGSSVTYTINVTNKGNMTAYVVPLELELLVESKNDITRVDIDGFVSHLSVPKELIGDSIEADVVQEIETIIDDTGDLCQFIFAYDSISCMDCGISQILMTIPPNSINQFTVTIQSLSTVRLDATLNKEWYPISFSNSTGMRIAEMRGSSKDWMCCYRERFKCVADVAANIVGLAASPAAGCATSLVLSGIETAYDVWCSDGSNTQERWNNYLKSSGQSLASQLIQTAVSCVTAYFRFLKSKLIEDRNIAAAIGNTTVVDQLNAEIQALRTMEISAIRSIYDGITTTILGSNCYKAFKEAIPNCPPDPGGGGGSSSPRRPCEPNEMLGYTAPSGSNYIGNGVTDVYYTICFENDSSATSPANVIILTDTIDSNVYDLSTFAPTLVKIGDVETQLSGDPNFVQTVDMRPRINCIAQVECNYDSQKGIVVFTLTSLDPMTMEPVTDYNQGMLPPNSIDNYGQGEMSFNISLKEGLPDGTVIKNRAVNIFDSEEPVFTPDWVNIIDAVNPTSRVVGCELLNDSTAIVSINGEDNRSGPWRYDIYTQYGDGEWYKTASEIPIDHTALIRVYEGIEHHLYAVLTDSAGNVEVKQPVCELTFDYFSPDTESNLTLNLAKNWNWMSHNLNSPLEVTALQPNAYRIVGQDGETIKDPRYGYTGTISSLDPTKLYKVQMTKAANVPLQGKLYNVAFKSTDLSSGWNWLGYPLAGSLAPSVALANLEAQEGDCLIGQDGMAMFNNGQWRGTLSQLTPGKGYMLKLQGNATLHWNAPSVSTRLNAPGMKQNCDVAPYTVDTHLYPTVMGIVADLYDSGSPVDPDSYWLMAFCGDECRGVAQTVDGHFMMNIYGNSGETITFKVIDRTTQAVDDVAESLVFTQDVEGTLQLPIVLTIGTSGLNNLMVKGLRVYPTVTQGDVNVSISYGDLENVEVLNAKGQTMMTLQNMGCSAVVGLSDLPDGIYMIRVTTSNGTSITKVVKQK